jgi:outer membrane protein insertion porin family
LVTVDRVNARRAFRGIPIILLAFIMGAAHALAQPPAGQTISQIIIEGNQRVEDDAIRVHVQSRPGEPINEALVDQDVKSIYKMGFFDQVTAELRPERGRVQLVYHVKERPLVSEVKLEGMKAIRTTDDKVVEATKVHPRAVLDPERAQQTIKELKKVYEDKGYLDATVTFESTPQPDNQVIAIFRVNEGPLVQITQIEFTGNHAFAGKQLRRTIETGTHNILSFVTGSGTLDRKKLEEDVDRLTAYYYDNGYLNVHVGEPVIARQGNGLSVTFNIDEGLPYQVGAVEFAGELKFPESELRDKLTLKSGTLFRGSTLQHDVLTLSDVYSNRGYAFVNVDPRTQLDAAAHVINVTFAITPGQLVLVDRIKISGNTTTSDKVIRRELRIQEQEPYSAESIRESKQRLDRLGFFDETRISTAPSTRPDRINLDVGVREGHTSSFQAAGGFSTASSVFGDFRIGDSNLFGGGQSIAVDATVGFLFQNYSISYSEPYFLDIPLTAGVELYDSQIFFLSFNRNAAGFALRTFYPLSELGLKKIGPLSTEDMSAGLQYKFESVGVTGINNPLTTFDIRRFKGYTQTSEVTPSIRRFSVDNPIDPRTGSVQTLTLQLAGLGGSNAFVKGVAHARFFFSFIDSPEFGNWVYSIGGDFGLGTNLKTGTGGDLPLFERFFPGGIGGGGDVRGYELYRLGPRVTVFNSDGTVNGFEEIGGSKELLASTEITFPILEALGLRGVIFLDAGNSYRLHDSIALTKLQASYGIGLRWRSPFGPLRIEFGRPINPRPDDQRTDFVFGAGSPL